MAIPEAIAGAPILREDLRWVWDAFSDLTTERAPGAMGPPGHIPWRAIYTYCSVHRITGPEFRHFKEVIKEMDDAYLAYLTKKIQEAQDKPGAS